MYSRKVIERNIERLARTGRALEYYAPAYIAACVAHLDSLALFNDRGKLVGLKRPLASDESAFIENERLLCAVDYHHWATAYHRIRDAVTLEMVPFRPNLYQRVLTGVQAQMEEEGRPIFIQLLKARQGGGTTDTTSKIEHRALFHPNTSGVIASSDPDKSWKLSEMITRSLAAQPWWFFAEDFKSFESGEVFLECNSRNISVTIQHGSQKSGISRGDTCNIAHFSELPGYLDPQRTINQAFMHTVHPSPKTLIVFESTAEGRNDWWHEFWDENSSMYPDGLSLIHPLFIPWYLSRDIYPTDSWLRSIPIPADYAPSEYVIEHARKAQDYVRSNPLMREIMGADWAMPVEQQWYYQFHYEQAKRKDDLGGWLSEMPSSPMEAFQSRSKSVFPIELIQEYEVRVPQPVGVFKLRGTEIPVRLEPLASEVLEFAEDGPKQLEVEYASPTTEYAGTTGRCRWSLIPMRFPGYPSVKSHLDALYVWEYPRDNEEYAVSLDAAAGIGRDRTVVSVVRKGTPGRAAGQVAVFASDALGGLEIWPVCLLLLKYYSTWSTHRNDYAEPLFAPETAADGASAMLEIRKRGWTNIYMRLPSDAREQSRDLLKQLGWLTTGRTRHILTTWLLRIIKGRFAEINSPWTIDEMRDFVAKDPLPGSRLNGEVRIEHDRKAHDDELFSLAIGLVTLHELDIYQGQTPQWASLVAAVEELTNFATYGDQVAGAKFNPSEFGSWEQQQGGMMYPQEVQIDY